MEYHFEWDPEKARENQRKHAVSFAQAATVFRDPQALSIYDDEHSVLEDRWVTLGLSAERGLLAVHHTFEEADHESVRIRIFSSRRATKREIKQYGDAYEEGI